MSVGHASEPESWLRVPLTPILGLLRLVIAGTAWAIGPRQRRRGTPPPVGRPEPLGGRAPGWARALGLGLCCAGLAGILVSGSILADAWYARWTWTRSEARQRIERELATGTPRWVEPIADGRRSTLGDAGDGTPEAAGGAVPRASDAGPSLAPDDLMLRTRDARPGGAPAVPSPIVVTPTFTPASGAADRQALEVTRAELRFLDPPEPGAHAQLAVTLGNRSDVPSRPVTIGIPADWFDRFRIIGAVPPVLDDRARGDRDRYFDFPGLPPGAYATLELHVLAVDEDVGAPEVQVALIDGQSLGRVRPEVVAPRARPGPVRALSVPRLGIRTGVVDTAWEPPPFVVGQVDGTAAPGEGNSVLVGHRGGLGGDVFARLAGARLGDDVVAASRGLEHRYAVSEIRILPGSDSTPMAPTDAPRLTLMTCIGAWNPLTGDYSHRLWVIADRPTWRARRSRLPWSAPAAPPPRRPLRRTLRGRAPMPPRRHRPSP